MSSPIRRLLARALWFSPEAVYAFYRLRTEPVDARALALLELLAVAADDGNRLATVLRRAREQNLDQALRIIAAISLTEALEREIETLVAEVREQARNPHGLTPEDLFRVLGPSWEGVSPPERITYARAQRRRTNSEVPKRPPRDFGAAIDRALEQARAELRQSA